MANIAGLSMLQLVAAACSERYLSMNAGTIGCASCALAANTCTSSARESTPVIINFEITDSDHLLAIFRSGVKPPGQGARGKRTPCNVAALNVLLFVSRQISYKNA